MVPPASTPAARPPLREPTLLVALLYVSLAAVSVAPLFYGSYPQWISGFAVAVIGALGCAYIAVAWITGARTFPVPRSVALLSILTLLWLCAMVARDAWLGTASGRFPVLSERTLPYAFAFLAAGMLGAGFGTPRRLKTLLGALTATGFVLAVLAIMETLGWDVKNFKASTADRPSGIFVSPNRLAVMLSLCASCGIGLLLASFKEPESGMIENRRRLVRQAALTLALAAMGFSIAYSLSRLTIAAFGAGLGIAAMLWTRQAWRRDDGLAFRDLPLADRIQRVVLFGLPLLVILAWGALAFGVGGSQLKKRLEEFGAVEADSRWTVAVTSLPLFDAPGAKAFGRGLGSFEPLYTAVQPASLNIGTLPGRWSRMHSDWLQFALEAGLPGLALLLALTGAWAWEWWRSMWRAQAGREPEALGLRLAPMAGIFTVAACSVADFPLRETGLALGFFFLAGALVRTHETAPCPRWRTAALGLPLVAALIWSGWIAGRNTLACAESPWRGQYTLPVDPGGDEDAWQRAKMMSCRFLHWPGVPDAAAWARSTEIDPGEPQLHYFLAMAADSTKNASREVLEDGLAHARMAAALSPCEFHAPWIAALLSEKLGDYAAAAAYHGQAIALFPENLPLHLDAGVFYLRRHVRGKREGNPARTEGVQKALSYFHFVVQRDAGFAEQIAGWMEDAGCTQDEIAALWEGGGETQNVARAKYFADHGQWDAAAKALSAIDPSNLKTRKKELIWYHVLRGMLDFILESDDKAIAHWSEALALGAVRTERPAYVWMSAHVRQLSADTTERTAAALVAQLVDAPLLVNGFGWRLRETGRDLSVCRLLEKTAGTTDYLCSLYADAALDLGDLPTAREQALLVARYKGAGRNWNAWHEQFEARFEQRVKRDAKN